jgi:ADP-heptose:LPS heptosyltransferase
VVVRDPQPRAGCGHAADWYAGALDEIGVPRPGHVDALLPSAEERAAAEEVTRRLPPGFLALHPGSGARSKNWPAERFAGLADALAPGQRVAVVHGPADDAAVSRLTTLLPRARVLAALPLPVLGAVLSRAGLFVGNDSGVSHLAAAYGAPTFALFGPTDPDVWAPPGARVLRAPGHDLARLGVAEVAAYVSGARTSSRLMSR